MNKVELELDLYNDLYNSKKTLEETIIALDKCEIEKEVQIVSLNNEIKGLKNGIKLLIENSIRDKSSLYTDEVSNFNIDSEKLAKHLTENYLDETLEVVRRNNNE